MKNKSSFKNIFSAFVSNGIAVVIGFIAQKAFISVLGLEYLGINNIFSNIISMLSIVDFGLSSAIIYNLYKPIAKGDRETIKSLMAFYRKAYRMISFAILAIGLIVMPFLPLIINDITVEVNLYLAYALAISDIAFSYFLSYRRSILYADKKNYIINFIHAVYLIVLNASQLILLYLTRNFYVYLGTRIVIRIIENLILHKISTAEYPYLTDTNAKKLDKKIEKDIFQKIRALFFHKIGSFIVLGTDNFIISGFLGIATVGLYSNYYTILHALTVIVQQAIMALTPNVGHLLVAGDKKKNFEVFKKIRFGNFLVAAGSALSFMIFATPFVEIWLGEEYLLSKSVLVVLTINYFLQIMRSSFMVFKEAAGIYHEDRFVPLIESALNIIVSIALVKLIGLPGVFIGTIISGLAYWTYSYPKFVYKKLFGRSYQQYIIETLGYFAIFGSAVATITVVMLQ